jgi:hypothetical protein
MKFFFCILIILISLQTFAQQIISGTVTDRKGQPILGANVYLEGTYDGTTTDENGEFRFTSTETGSQTLIVSFLSFLDFKTTQDVTELKNLLVVLKEDVNTLDAVELNAGMFEAGEESRVTALNSLDVVTTASALGDFLGALQTLPGTSTNAEDGRLFVRGGNADETQIFIDGIRVFAPFTPTANNIPTRG